CARGAGVILGYFDYW
nr:immunoglobulin heavy chain junction region [Macaca mulatta]MOW82470.1 immunoglobulin heavy chain junction region [Macaca mulatta]MOW83971.1 immunoglobulin heavy chain junction region [Macaca mulatta]